jgi:hypothetical protein
MPEVIYDDGNQLADRSFVREGMLRLFGVTAKQVRRKDPS